MQRFLKLHLPFLIVFGVALGLLALLYFKQAPPPPPTISKLPPPSVLSTLVDAPDWALLEPYQETITREDFERLLSTVFTTGEAWRTEIVIDEEEARISTGPALDKGIFHLRFAKPGSSTRAPRHWRTAAELPPAPAGKPLDGLRIALDPGHIGGEWAKMEERWFVIGNGSPVTEGDMTLHVARLLKPKLEALGAIVTFVREKPEPVTPLRPASLMASLQDTPDQSDSPGSLQKLAERLFYRTAEIRARAKLVNETLKPDLVLCLHFNAEAWGDPLNPTLIDRTHLHLLLNGGYTDEETALPDQRFALLQKLLQRTHEEEVKVGSTVAEIFARVSGLPPFTYPAGSQNVRAVDNNRYLWARNLLANRLYDCPVIFMEPYVMNSIQDYNRIQAGDYEGLRMVNGKEQPSIFHEYADALTSALEIHYRQARALTSP